MAEKAGDFNLPLSVIIKLIKDAFPENVAVSKDARLALSKATSFFIVYLSTFANNVATENARATLTEQDVFVALNQLGFVQFLPHLQQCYDEHKKEKARKQRLKARLSSAKAKLNSSKASNVTEAPHIDLNLDSPPEYDDCIIVEEYIDETINDFT